ncbi:squalene--hopene cyclase [Nocardia sp. NPDC049149]|uniref:squalene--hopene cyclase n=1 Tax=Nocardia sp. NPDC049149 TaxID=3364315 RepID=UPI0037135769
MSPDKIEWESGVADALRRSLDHLLGLQSPQGWWCQPLATCAINEAGDLFLREFLGIRDETKAVELARWLRSQQRSDGTWAKYHAGPGDLSTTLTVYVALRICGDNADEPHLLRTANWIRENGGVAQASVITRFWLAMLGLWSWDDIPVLPPELTLLPTWAPLNIYSWANWTRHIVVPLAVIAHFRPVRSVGFTLTDLAGDVSTRPRPTDLLSRAFYGADYLLQAYQRLPVKPLRQTALRRAEQWIIERQDSDGSWAGVQQLNLYSIAALSALGLPVDHPVLAAGLRNLDTFVVHEETPDGPAQWIQMMQGPVWDTALSLLALTDAGVDTDHPALKRAADWLLTQEVRTVGDWAKRRPGLSPGGWSFEFVNIYYPDLDDTSMVVRALTRLHGSDSAVQRGVAWGAGMQSRDGGWAAFDADNTETLVKRLPFNEFADVTDPPSADVTAHMVEMLAEHGERYADQVEHGVRWLLDHQEADGSWFGRWGVNYVYGTGAVVPALIGAGLPAKHHAIRRAVRWLEEHQNSDGGWGEDPLSYVDPKWIGSGTSTASQTAWALLALIAASGRSPAVDRGIDWLIQTQRPDGGWDEPQFTGTGLPDGVYIHYSSYSIVFPLSALGRYQALSAATEAGDSAERER